MNETLTTYLLQLGTRAFDLSPFTPRVCDDHARPAWLLFATLLYYKTCEIRLAFWR